MLDRYFYSKKAFLKAKSYYLLHYDNEYGIVEWCYCSHIGLYHIWVYY